MLRKLILSSVILFSTQALGAEPIVEPAHRAKQPINKIRQMLRAIPAVDAERAERGLEPVINLGIGQPHLPMNARIIDGLIAELQEWKKLPPEGQVEAMAYCHAAGRPETREVISRFYSYTFPETQPFSSEEVMICNGACGAMTIALKALVNPGDRVGVYSPYFAGYKNQIAAAEGTLVEMELKPGQSHGELLAQYPDLKVLIWNDPNNPMGTKLKQEELQALAAVLEREPNLIIIHDEVYRDIVHHGEPLSLLNVAPELKNRSIVIRSLAKDIAGAPCIRAGMVSAPTDLLTPSGERVNLLERMANEQLRDIVTVSALVQSALRIALEEKMAGRSGEWEQEIRSAYAKSVEVMADALAAIGCPPYYRPEGAFYLLADMSRLRSAQLQTDVDVAHYLLHSAGVAVTPASGFGLDPERCVVRISCANEVAVLEAAAQRIAKLVEGQQQ